MQHFWYQIKIIFRNPGNMFWGICFPLILGTLFYFMFANLDAAEQFSEVPVGIVGAEENEIFEEMMETVEVDDGVSMFEVTKYDDEADAEEALKQEEIKGYILVEDEDFELVVKESSISASVIKTFIDQYKQNMTLIGDVAVNNPEKVAALVTGLYQEDGVTITEIPLKGQDKSAYNQYFYALLAFACLVATTVGVQNGQNVQADLSPVGARRNVSPTEKMRQVLIDFLATLCIYCILMAGVLAVLVLVFKRDFGDNIPLILLGTWVGSFVGLAAGTMISVVSKGSKQSKDAKAVTFFMASSFLGGLQWVDITYILEKNCPIINRINPATLIVNSFKSLAVFGDYRQYAVNVVTLLGIGTLFLVISIVKLRRTRYASL